MEDKGNNVEPTENGNTKQEDTKPSQNRKPNNKNNNNANQNKDSKPNNKNNNRNKGAGRGRRRQSTPIDENLKKFVALNQEGHKQRLNPHFKLDLNSTEKIRITPLGGLGEIGGNITVFETQKEAILVESKQEAYALVKNLTKWIILKEVQDKEYVERLLEKLILEINTKSNLLIRINEEDFADLPGVIEKVESRLGALTNIRIEIGHDMVDRGIILESEVGVVDGSFKSQMKSLDKLFENVGIMEKASDD